MLEDMISVGPPPGTPIVYPSNYHQQTKDKDPVTIHPKKINIVQQQDRVFTAQESQRLPSPQPQVPPQPQQMGSQRNYTNPQLSPRAYIPQGNQPYTIQNQAHPIQNQPQSMTSNTGNIQGGTLYSNYYQHKGNFNNN